MRFVFENYNFHVLYFFSCHVYIKLQEIKAQHTFKKKKQVEACPSEAQDYSLHSKATGK
jgi:hypothetical protein